jgi:hypothetical protein
MVVGESGHDELLLLIELRPLIRPHERLDRSESGCEPR